MGDSRLTRTKMVISLDRDIGSFVSLVDLFESYSHYNTREIETLHGKMLILVAKMNGILASLKALSDADPQYEDADYIAIITDNTSAIEFHMANFYNNRENPVFKTANHTRLIAICTEFKNHLDALRLLYEACIPQLMQNILTSMEKIQKKLGDP